MAMRTAMQMWLAAVPVVQPQMLLKKLKATRSASAIGMRWRFRCLKSRGCSAGLAPRRYW